jgi:hypothetical protein
VGSKSISESVMSFINQMGKNENDFKKSASPGVNVMITIFWGPILCMIFEIFLSKKLAFFVQNTGYLGKICTIALAFKKNAIFSPKIG